MTLYELELKVEAGLRGFKEIGGALRQIRDLRLYKPIYSDWQSYCRERWNLDGRYANRLIQASKLANELGPMGPKNERQGREIGKLPESVRERVLTQLHATDRPTSTQIRQARVAIAGMSTEQKWSLAAKEEEKGLAELSRMQRREIVQKIERLSRRMRKLHARLPVKEECDGALDAYLAIVGR